MVARWRPNASRKAAIHVVSDDERRSQARRRASRQLSQVIVSSFVGKVVLASALILFFAILLIIFDVLDPGSAADWMAAAGAIFAAVVALGIATRDRSERRDEGRVAALAQMRLVKIDVHDWEDSGMPDVQLRVSITNYGERPILQVLMLTAEVESLSAGVFKLSDPTPGELRIIPTVMQPDLAINYFDVAMKNEVGERWQPRRLEAHRSRYVNGMRVTLQCLDADGQHWTLANEADPVRHQPDLGPPVWQRLWTHRREVAAELWAVFGPNRKSLTRLAIASAVFAALLLMIFIARHWQWFYCVFLGPL